MTNSAETMVGPAPLESVIDQSMTVLAETMVGPAPLQNVIDQSMTVFIGSTPCGEVHLYKMSLTGQ